MKLNKVSHNVNPLENQYGAESKKKQKKGRKTNPSPVDEVAKASLGKSEITGENALKGPQSPVVSPLSSPIMKAEIQQVHALFQSSRELTSATSKKYAEPHSSENANDVYMSDFSHTEEVQPVVFKPGKDAAQRAVICSGLAKMVGLGESIPVAKTGVASVVGKDIYTRLTREDGVDILVVKESLDKVSDFTKGESGEVTCRIDSTHISLFPKEKNYQYQSNETAFGKALKKKEDFIILTDDKYLLMIAPKNSVYDVLKGDYVQVNGHSYLVKQKEGKISLELKQKVGPETMKIGGPDTKLLKTQFLQLYRQDPEEEDSLLEVVVGKDSAIKISKENKDKKEIPFTYNQREYEAIRSEDGVYKLENIEEEEEEKKELFIEGQELVVCHDTKGRHYLAPVEDSLPISKDEKGEFVLLNGERYTPKADGIDIKVFGESVKGMVQAKVMHIFTRPENARFDLDIKGHSPAREAFFKRIDMPSFIDSFLLTILLRPQDGKIVDLGQSNVLFQAIPDETGVSDPQKGMLKPILIDLDETLPEKNGYSTDPQIIRDGKHEVHSVRCGLMGFPQARKKLDKEEKARVTQILGEMVKKQGEIHKYLEKISKDRSTATNEIIEKLANFLEQKKDASNWTLENLFFSVFPEYQKQWNMLGDDDPALKASRIGLESEESLKKPR